MNMKCFITKIKLTEEDGKLKEADLAGMSELRPPGVMPKGNVGTPTAYFLEKIQQCRLPAKVIAKLKLEFPRARRRRIYGAVPPMEEEEDKKRRRRIAGNRLGQPVEKDQKLSDEEKLNKGVCAAPKHAMLPLQQTNIIPPDMRCYSAKTAFQLRGRTTDN